MKNQDIHIGIVGAGNIGFAIYQLLVSTGEKYKVSIADQIENKNVFISEEHYVKLKVTIPTYEGESTQFNEFVSDKTLIINALPFHQNINLYKACRESNVAYFDLSEDDALDKYIAQLLSNKEEIPFTMPHCGLAPGMSSIIASDLIKQVDNPQNIKIRVGALSQNAINKLRYYTSWSGEGLVNEYLGDCQVVRKGKYDIVDALSGYEKITIDGREFEAFHTSGGIGSLARTLAESDFSGDIDYKTLRRIGHHDYVDFLFNDLQLDQSSLTQIFKTCIPQTRKDEVIIFVSVSNETEDVITYHKVFKPASINGRNFTAIEYTTAIGLLAMVEMYVDKMLPQTGYVKQEDADWQKVKKTMYGVYYRQG
jgi:saccharopine dehydrogenase-like NADP-dependent oxidoreductase